MIPCPHLPKVDRVWRADDMLPFRRDRSAAYYEAALSYAQSLWIEGKPAQALLQLNKALSADLSGNESVLEKWPPPYRAKAWIIFRGRSGTAFLGNPVRHYQHLATRMNAIHPIPRRWRAWACFHLAESFADPSFERDHHQIQTEDIVIPTMPDVAAGLEAAGWPGERAAWGDALAFTRSL